MHSGASGLVCLPILVLIERLIGLQGIVLESYGIHLGLKLVLLVSERLEDLARLQFELLDVSFDALHLRVNSVDLVLFARIRKHHLYLSNLLPLLAEELLLLILLSAESHMVFLLLFLAL